MQGHRGYAKEKRSDQEKVYVMKGIQIILSIAILMLLGVLSYIAYKNHSELIKDNNDKAERARDAKKIQSIIKKQDENKDDHDTDKAEK